MFGRDPYKQGKRACPKGEHPHANPYPSDDWRYDQWLSGWADAQHKYHLKRARKDKK